MQRFTDWIFEFLWICVFVAGSALALAVVLWLLWIFVSVIYLGGGSSCPQNLC